MFIAGYALHHWSVCNALKTLWIVLFSRQSVSCKQSYLHKRKETSFKRYMHFGDDCGKCGRCIRLHFTRVLL